MSAVQTEAQLRAALLAQAQSVGLELSRTPWFFSDRGFPSALQLNTGPILRTFQLKITLAQRGSCQVGHFRASPDSNGAGPAPSEETWESTAVAASGIVDCCDGF